MGSLKQKHVMVDIETLGQSPGYVILSIGAVTFDSEGIQRQFNEEISKESCEDYGMKIDEGTKEWWDKQDASYTEKGKPLPKVLQNFSDWLPSSEFKMWAKSPSFDCEFLKDAYSRCGMETGWNYWEERDVRTAEEFFSHATDGKSPEPDKLEGTDHEPLYDAKKQALSVLISKRKIRRTSKN